MRILLTGTSSGLGRVLANHLKDEDLTLVTKGDCLQDYDVEAVIHCAGGGLGLKENLMSSHALYTLFMANLGRAVDINRLCLPKMIERKKGFIVHVCSIASGEAVGSVGYNTVKAALAAYVRSLGREMAPHGVVISGVSPGGFISPGNAMDRLKENNQQAYHEFKEKRLPRGFMGRAEELIPLIQLLISDGASMMNGCVVPIDAGEGRYYT